jgi:hypothetical protein
MVDRRVVGHQGVAVAPFAFGQMQTFSQFGALQVATQSPPYSPPNGSSLVAVCIQMGTVASTDTTVQIIVNEVTVVATHVLPATQRQYIKMYGAFPPYTFTRVNAIWDRVYVNVSVAGTGGADITVQLYFS